MNAYIKKNQKKIMAVFSVGLMIAFALPSAVKNTVGGREQAIGYIGTKETVTNKDVAEAKMQLDMLRQVALPAPPDRTGAERPPVGVTQYLLGADAAGELVNNPEVFVLLRREAARAGVAIPQEEVYGYLRARVRSADESVNEGELYPAMESLLMVYQAAERAMQSVHVSQPMVNDAVSREQQMSLNLVEFKAQDYLAKLPQWSDAEKADKINKQYEAYKNVEPTTKPTNEFTFGYRVPNQVRVQYIEVSSESAKAAAKAAIEKEGPLDIAAARYYQSHPQMFPASQPVDRTPVRAVPPPPTVANPAAPKPTSQKALANTFLDATFAPPAPPTTQPKTFKDYRDKARDAVIDERAAKLTSDVLADIQTQMGRDFSAFRRVYGEKIPPTATSMPTTAPGAIPTTPLGVAYNDIGYLKALALAEQKQFGLLPAVHEDLGLRTEKQLAADANPIAKSSLRGYDLMTILRNFGGALTQQTFQLAQQQAQQLAPLVQFPFYVTTFVEPLMNDQSRQTSRAAKIPSLELYAPSAVLDDRGDAMFGARGSGNSYVARVVEAVPTHPAPKADVMDQLLTDAKLKDAYDLARADAGKFAAEAQKSHLQPAAFAAGKKVTTTGLFSAQFPVATGFVTEQPTAAVFVNAAYGLLKAGQKTDHPVGVVDFKPQASVVVGEVNEIKPLWAPDMLATMQREAKLRQDVTLQRQLRALWFSQQDVEARLQYRPAEGARKPQPSNPQSPTPQPDPNPFSVILLPTLTH